MTMSSVLLLIGGLVAIWTHAQLRVRLKQEQRLTGTATATARDMLRLLAPLNQRQDSHAADRWRQDLRQDAADLEQKATAIQEITAGSGETDVSLAARLPELIDRYGRDLERLPETPSDAERKIVADGQEKIRQALLDVILERQDRLADFMQASRQRIDVAIWLLVAVMSCALYTALKGHSHLQELLVQPLDQVISLLRTALNNPAESVFLPGQENQQLDSLATLCNTILAERLRAEDASRSQLADMRKTADSLIAVFPDPTVVLAGSQEVLLANPAAWEWLANEAGKSMRQRLLEAIAAETTEFESHGLRFSLAPLAPAQGRTSPLLAIYQFKQLGPAHAPAKA